jgi:serine/threonine protein kinase
MTKRKEERRILVRYKKYLVYDEIIGTGTYSKVYLGLDSERNVNVAVK